MSDEEDNENDEFSDLSNFGGGYEPDDPNPEDKDNRLISQWLTRSGNDVYWDRKKSYGRGTFTTGLRRTPDLVIDSQNKNYAVEMKRPESSTKVNDGPCQVFQYWRDLETGRAEYKINGKDIEIDAVLLATRNSPAGHLYEDKRGKDPKRTGRSRGGNRVVEKGHMPEVEHAASESVVRATYRFARLFYKENDDVPGETGFGALYSSALDGDESGVQSTPAAFYLRPGVGSAKSHTWEYLPFYKKNKNSNAQAQADD
jgi:hypothetical protein